MPRPVLIACCWLVALAGTRAATAQAVVVPAESTWLARHWDTTSGLPQNTVAGLVQSSDGMVWAATFGGLCRFDGDEWTLFDSATTPELGDSRITALALGPDGAVWLGSEQGLVLRHGADGAFAPVAEPPNSMVRFLRKMPDGRVVLGTEADVFVVGERGQLLPFHAQRLPRSKAVAVLPDGDVLVCGENGVVRVRGSTARSVCEIGTWDCELAPDGTPWFATRQGLMRWQGERVVPALDGAPADGARGNGVTTLTATARGLWYGTDVEVGLVDCSALRITDRFATKMPVHAVFEDVAGGIWVGTNGGGLSRLARCEARGIALPENGLFRTATAVLPDGDDAFLVGTSHGLFRVAGGVPSKVPEVGDHGVHALYRDGKTLWLGHDTAVGRLVDGTYDHQPAPPEVSFVRALVRDADGRLLAGTETGVRVVDDGWAPYAPAAALRADWVKMIVPWRDGDLWVVGRRGVLHLDRDGATRAFLRVGEDLPLAEVRAVLPGPAGRAWFATYGSGFVTVEDGRTLVVGPSRGLPDAYLCSAAPFGRYWLVGGNRGPFLVLPETLAQCAAGAADRVYSRQLACTRNLLTEANGGVQPSIATTANDAALCGVAGLWLLDAAGLRDGGPPPVCHVRPALHGGQRVSDGADGRRAIELEGDRTFLVVCTAPEFDAPETMTFRWRWRGETWSPPSLARTMSLTAPGPGSFVAEFMAVRGDGVASAIVPLELVVRPMWWERAWVPVLASAFLMALVIAGFRFGSRRSARHAEHLRRLVDARTAELTIARDSLEQRVAQRTAELRRALEQLDEDHRQRLRLERELEQMRRMESLGQLAGSVAHDFNNLLTVVLGNADLLRMTSSPTSDAYDMANRIMEAARRGREMTQRLLAVASRQTVVPRVLDLGEALRGQVDVLRDVMGSSFRVVLTVEGEPLCILAAQGQIEQVLVNLASNARQAMPNGGTLTIHASRGDRHVRLVVADDGPGMKAEVRARAFEPFFTTRGGTGLGLATVYGITKQLQGDVVIESAPSIGTRFTFTFPAVAAAAEPVAETTVAIHKPAPPAPVGRRRVLLIEDEADVRRAMRGIIEACGFAVAAEAESGGDAVRLLAESAVAVDVVVSDVRMPGLQGMALVRALRGIRRALPILFVSGHTSSAQLLAELAPFGIEMVTKPPVREELRKALERALQAAPVE